MKKNECQLQLLCGDIGCTHVGSLKFGKALLKRIHTVSCHILRYVVGLKMKMESIILTGNVLKYKVELQFSNKRVLV